MFTPTDDIKTKVPAKSTGADDVQTTQFETIVLMPFLDYFCILVGILNGFVLTNILLKNTKRQNRRRKTIPLRSRATARRCR